MRVERTSGPGLSQGWMPAALRRGAPAGQAPAVRESSAAHRSNSQTSLTVVTAEGDRVTISLAAQAKIAAIARVTPYGRSEASSASVTSQVRVKVEGNLSEAELEDLGDLFTALGQATSQARESGGIDAATLAGTVAGLDTLAGFRYHHRETVQTGLLVRAVG